MLLYTPNSKYLLPLLLLPFAAKFVVLVSFLVSRFVLLFRLSMDGGVDGFYPGCRLHGRPPSLLMANGIDGDEEDEDEDEDDEDDEDEDDVRLRDFDLRETQACLRSRSGAARQQQRQQQQQLNGGLAPR